MASEDELIASLNEAGTSIEKRLNEQLARRQKVNPGGDPRKLVVIQTKPEQGRLERAADKYQEQENE